MSNLTQISALVKMLQAGQTDIPAIFALVAAGKLDQAGAAQAIADYTDAIKAAATKKPGQLTLKVSPKGAVSVYGLNSRFPITLYSGQWDRLLNHADAIRKFCGDHKSQLSTK